MRNIALLLALAVSLLLPFAAQARDRPESVADRYASAWNAHDAAAFDRLFAEDADWVTATGARLEGRDEIRSFLAREHSTWAKATTLSVANTTVRKIDRRNVVVSFDWMLSGGVGRDGKPVEGVHGVILLVVTRGPAGWQVVAGQVAKATGGG